MQFLIKKTGNILNKHFFVGLHHEKISCLPIQELMISLNMNSMQKYIRIKFEENLSATFWTLAPLVIIGGDLYSFATKA